MTATGPTLVSALVEDEVTIGDDVILRDFVSLIALVSNHVLKEGVYYLHSQPSSNEAQKILDLARLVTELQVSGDEATSSIATSALLYLFGLKRGDVPFFPRLRVLRLSKPDDILPFYPFFLSPSVQHLEAENIGSARQSDFSHLFAALAEASPKLITLSLVGPFKPDIFDNLPCFRHLETLKIDRIGHPLDFSLIEQLAATLPALESLTLACDDALYKTRDSKTNRNAQFRKLRYLSLTAGAELIFDVAQCFASTAINALLLSILQAATATGSTFNSFFTSQADYCQVCGLRLAFPTGKKRNMRPQEVCQAGCGQSRMINDAVSLFLGLRQDQLSLPTPSLLSRPFLHTIALCNEPSSLCLEDRILDGLLSCPTLESFNLTGCKTPTLTSVLETSTGYPSLKTLELPSSSSLDCNALRNIAIRYPNLHRLECAISTEGTTWNESATPSSHGLANLHVLQTPNHSLTAWENSTAVERSKFNSARSVARSIDCLFPNLVDITTSQPKGPLRHPWDWIWEVVKTCQAVRGDERARVKEL